MFTFEKFISQLDNIMFKMQMLHSRIVRNLTNTFNLHILVRAINTIWTRQRCPLWGSTLSTPCTFPLFCISVLFGSFSEGQRTAVRSAQQLTLLCDPTSKPVPHKYTNVIVTLSNPALILYILSSVPWCRKADNSFLL